MRWGKVRVGPLDSDQQGQGDLFTSEGETVRENTLRISSADAARLQAIKAAQDGKALLRRSYYVYCMSAASFGLILTTLFVPSDPVTARTIVESSFSLLEIIAVAYLGANVIDRSRLVDRFVPNTPNPPPRD